ncbi:MAG: NACHT domain-containing protein, partial [Planctomycetaceae bacterium]|nr:NACHT domain-containing protein [Planctomycetaceae bacterium]
MLEKVRKIWITGFLERSLSHETRILLGLSERPDAVARPMDLLVQRPDRGERPLPPGTQVVDVFDTMEQLLILGQPGSGKTTLLLELARDLLDRAARDPRDPIPVVFPLSTWAEARRPLAEWLAEELYQRYDVPRKIGLPWVEADQILPLLDGLDEVKPEHRAACVEAINAFRQSHGLLPLVTCSRTPDYQALAARLRLQGAIVVQPLSPQQVDSYLTEIGPAGAAVRRAIGHDPMLGEMLDSPLMLNIITVAYAGQPGSQPRLSGTLEERRDHLFGAYVDKMFKRGRVDRRYTPQQTIHWLTWLAWQMVRYSQTVFYIERLQPDWHPGERRWAFGLDYRLVVGLVVGLVGGLGVGLGYRLGVGLVVGLVGR